MRTHTISVLLPTALQAAGHHIYSGACCKSKWSAAAGVSQKHIVAFTYLRSGMQTCQLRPCPTIRHTSPQASRSNQHCFKSSRQPPRTQSHIVRATEEDGKSGLDWDKAWSGFVDGLNKNIPVVEDRTVARPEEQKKTSSKSPQFAKDSRRNLRENIKKQENFVLDFWSQESFFKLGGVLIVLLLAVFLVAGRGGPPE